MKVPAEIIVPIPEPVEALQPICGTYYDSETDVPTMPTQLCQVFEPEFTISPMNDIILRYAFKGLRRVW